MNPDSFPSSLIVQASRAISRYAAHQRVLEAMALRLPLTQVLTRLVDSIEDAAPGALASVLLVNDAGSLVASSTAPGLPAMYNEQMAGLEIGPACGSCGTAMWRKERVIVDDIEHDPLWKEYRKLALPHGLRACWSTPIVASDGTVLGSFAMYYRNRRRPTDEEIRIVDEAVDLATVAIGQERAEAAVRRSEAHFRTVIETAPSAIVGLALNGQISEWNRAAVRLFGRHHDEVLGRRFSDLCLTEIGRNTFEQCAVAARRERNSMSCETEIVHVSGQSRWVLWSMSLANTDIDGGSHGDLLAIGQDITDRLQAEAALRRSEQQLRHSQKMEAVGRLAGGIAHDFNNLLTVIHGNATLALHDAEPGSEQHLALDEVREAATRATALTRQLLAFSRREPVEPLLLDLNVIVEDLRRMLGRLIGEHIQLTTTLSSLPAIAKADRTNIEQLLLNLAVNARDAMRNGGALHIVTEHMVLTDEEAAVTELAPGNYIRLSVSDTGSGMDEVTRARAFEPFFTTKPAGEGTGLGLATVYAIADRHNGAVTIDSQPGAGTTVSLLLPRASGDAAAVHNSGEHAIQRGSGTILVVEDEEAVRHLARRVLNGHGFRVLEATDGEDALRVWKLHRDEIDVVVTDVVMPRLGGQALVDALRADREHIPVVFCSGYSDTLPQVPLGDEAYTTFLAKPFTLHGLVERVARLAANSRRAR